MTGDERLRWAGLLAASAVLAAFELLYLPLRLDGRVLPDVGALPFPVTVVVAALTLPRLVRLAGRISPRGPVAGGPLLAWLATLLAFLVVAPGGDAVVLADWRTLLLLGAGAFPAAFALGDVLASAQLTRKGDTGSERP